MDDYPTLNFPTERYTAQLGCVGPECQARNFVNSDISNMHLVRVETPDTIDDVALVFSCEFCDTLTVLNFTQHKGQVFVHATTRHNDQHPKED